MKSNIRRIFGGLLVLFVICLFPVITSQAANYRWMGIGDTAILSDENYYNATGYTKTWTCTDYSVASINPSGMTCRVTGLKSGTVTVTCSTYAWKTVVTSHLGADGKWYQMTNTTNYTSTTYHVITVRPWRTVTFSGNGGTTSYKTKRMLEDVQFGSLPKATRKGYTFQGWYTAKKGGTKITEKSTCTGTKTYYARWKKISTGKGEIASISTSYRKIHAKAKSVANADGYQIRYSTNKSLKNAKSKTSTGQNFTLSSLTSGKKYYIQVRAYKIDSAKKKVYGKWSNKKSCYVDKYGIDTASVKFLVGQTKKLKFQGTSNAPSWSSDNKKVVTVSKGKLTAKGKGTATVTASYKGKKYKCKVTVEAPSLTKKAVGLLKGQTKSIALKNTSYSIKWTSSDTSVATVSSKGKITAIGKGTADITATANGKKYCCKVTVEEPYFEEKPAVVLKGKTSAVRLSGTSASQTYMIKDEEIATVSKTGMVTGKKVGTTDLVVTVRGKSFTCKINVEDPWISKTEVTIYKSGYTYLFMAGTTVEAVWSSNDESVAKVAKVESAGKVTGVKAGTAIITANVKGVLYQCKVTVKEPYLNETRVDLEVNDSFQLILYEAVEEPTWSTTDETGGIKLTQTGKVTVLKPGVYYVKATVTKAAYTCTIVVKGDPGTVSNPIPVTEDGCEVITYFGDTKVAKILLKGRIKDSKELGGNDVTVEFEITTNKLYSTKKKYAASYITSIGSVNELCYTKDFDKLENVRIKADKTYRNYDEVDEYYLKEGTTIYPYVTLAGSKPVYDSLIFALRTGYDTRKSPKQQFTYFIMSTD